MVNGGFSDPEECKCRKELCSVKTTDLSCIQKNRECQKERKKRLEKIGKGSRLHTLFKQLLDGIDDLENDVEELFSDCLLYTSPSPRDATLSRMPSSA